MDCVVGAQGVYFRQFAGVANQRIRGVENDITTPVWFELPEYLSIRRWRDLLLATATRKGGTRLCVGEDRSRDHVSFVNPFSN